MGEKVFGKGYWKTFREGIQREWVITNGIGGYAGSSIIGAHTRKHHGMLIASLHAPTERYMVLSKVEEALDFGGKKYSLKTNQRIGKNMKTVRIICNVLFIMNCLHLFIR